MTPAVKALERAGVTHRVMAYDHDPESEAYGVEAATALGIDPALVFKTLVATLDDDRPVVAIVAVSTRLDLKALAAAAGAKRARLADQGDAERLTGYVRGGISPLGQRRRLPTFLDCPAGRLPLIYVSAGRRGVDVELSPHDLLVLCQGTLAPISARAPSPK